MRSANEMAVAEKIIALTNQLDKENASHLKEQLSAFINDMITNDFSGLVQLLYRVDVDEKKLKDLLQQNQLTDAADTISALIIERQIKKNETRKKFKTPNDTTEDELW